MDRMRYLLKVEGKAVDKKVQYTYEGEDGKNHKQTVNHHHVEFPLIEDCTVDVVGHDPQNPDIQLWYVEGPHDVVVGHFDQAQPLSMKQAKELNWGLIPTSPLPLFEPK